MIEGGFRRLRCTCPFATSQCPSLSWVLAAPFSRRLAARPQTRSPAQDVGPLERKPSTRRFPKLRTLRDFEGWPQHRSVASCEMDPFSSGPFLARQGMGGLRWLARRELAVELGHRARRRFLAYGRAMDRLESASPESVVWTDSF